MLHFWTLFLLCEDLTLPTTHNSAYECLDLLSSTSELEFQAYLILNNEVRQDIPCTFDIFN